MRSPLRVLGVMLVLTGSSCVADDEVEVDDLEGKEDGVARPIGTFNHAMERTDDSWGGIYLSLMTDKQARREEDIDPFVGPTIERGTYKYTRTGTKRFITLTLDGTVNKYQYTFADDTLRLRSPNGQWVEYESSMAKCDEHEDCELQDEPSDARCYYSGCIVDDR